MSRPLGLFVCVFVLAIGAKTASAHTTRVCWRVENNGTVTLFAGTYHGDPGVFGGIFVDGVLHSFASSTTTLPADITGCQEPCPGALGIVKWQIANAAIPYAPHAVTLTSTTAVEAPFPGCYPATLTFGGSLPTTLAYTGETYVANGEPVVLAGLLRANGVAPIAGRTVDLTLGSGATAQSCSGVTDASGTATCVIDAAAQPLNEGATLPIAAAFAGDASYLPSTAAAEVLLQYMTGDAYAIAGTAHVVLGTLGVPRTPSTGAVRTADATATSTPCTAALGAKLLGLEVIGAKLLCANVTTELAPGTGAATAGLETATIALGGVLPVIQLTGVSATSRSTCGGASGLGTVGSLSIGGVTIPIGTGPSFTVPLPLGGRITINEQVPAEDADHGLTVRGAHIVVPPALGLAGVDLVLASATSAIHNCRRESALPPFSAADDGEDHDREDALESGGCQASRPGGGPWLAAAAAPGVAIARRRRRRARRPL